jgi:hypothetical protein
LSIYCDAEGIIDEAIEDMSDRIYDDVRADVEMEFHSKGYEWPAKVPQILKTAWETISNHNSDNQYKRLLDEITNAIEQLNIKNDN